MRPESRFVAADDAGLDGLELLAALKAVGAVSDEERQGAIARALSASDGWEEALQLLGGAFAARLPINEGGEERINQPISEYLQRPPLKAADNVND